MATKNSDAPYTGNWMRPLIRVLQLKFNPESKTKDQDAEVFNEQVLQMVSLASLQIKAA